MINMVHDSLGWLIDWLVGWLTGQLVVYLVNWIGWKDGLLIGKLDN